MNSRISLILSDAQLAVLKTLSEQQQKPRTVLIRDAVQEYVARHAPTSSPQDVFGLWRNKKADSQTNSQTDGLQYQETLRDEW